MDETELQQWQKLQREIRQFGKEGLLNPVKGKRVNQIDHYRNYSDDPVRKVPRLIYDKVVALPYSQKKLLIPAVNNFYTLTARPSSSKKSWLKHTEYTIKKYDRWYWKMRNRRTPFDVAWRALLGRHTSEFMKKIHWYHVKEAIERNCKRVGPPIGLFTQEHC